MGGSGVCSVVVALPVLAADVGVRCWDIDEDEEDDDDAGRADVGAGSIDVVACVDALLAERVG